MKPSRGRPERALIGLALLVAAVLPCHADAPLPARLKTAFVYYFFEFVEWPEHSKAATRSPFVLGIVGNDEVADSLKGLQNKTKLERTIKIALIEPGQRFPACHILYVAASERSRFKEVLKKLHGKPTLTVGDWPGFVAAGGMIGFFLEGGGKYRFEIAPWRARSSGLVLSSQLLQAARIISREDR